METHENTGKSLLSMILLLLIGAGIACLLWNAILPTLFNLPGINYWQALGLKVLFNSFTSRIKFNS